MFFLPVSFLHLSLFSWGHTALHFPVSSPHTYPSTFSLNGSLRLYQHWSWQLCPLRKRMSHTHCMNSLPFLHLVFCVDIQLFPTLHFTMCPGKILPVWPSILRPRLSLATRSSAVPKGVKLPSGGMKPISFPLLANRDPQLRISAILCISRL